MKCLYFTLFALFGVVSCDVQDYEDCFKKDSISCLQMQLFNNAKDLLSQKSIDIFGGLSLVKDSNRSEKSLENLVQLEEEVMNATDVSNRQAAIEDYLVRKARDVVWSRSIRWNVGESARALSGIVPNDLKMKLNNFVVEARGKKKKLMKYLMPALIGLKLKIAIITIIAFLGIVVLAKKALLAAAVSLAISGYIGIKKLLAPKPAVKTVSYEDNYHAAPSWSQGTTYSGSSSWSHEGHPDYGSPAAGHNLAYAAHKSS